MQDVARLAGVSAAPVSYVVNGRMREVGAETRKKIESAIQSLRYQPQRKGISLKLNREFAIGLVIVDPHPNFLSDPFTTEVAAGLGNALTEPGQGLTVTGCTTEENFDAFLRRPIGVDALLSRYRLLNWINYGGGAVRASAVGIDPREFIRGTAVEGSEVELADDLELVDTGDGAHRLARLLEDMVVRFSLDLE